MAKKKKGKAGAGLAVLKDAKGNVYIIELGDPVTDSLNKSERESLRAQFDDYRKSPEGKANSADAVIIDDATGTHRIMQRGNRQPTGDGGGGDGGKTKKKT